MSNNLQWKIFQPPNTHSDILDLQHSNMQGKPSHRNGTYNIDYSSSPRDSHGNMSNTGRSGNYMSYNSAESAVMMGDSQGSQYTSPPSNSSSQHYDSQNHPPIRETGIIEKLLHSYGFIQCCERQARLFFHFSQFSGNIEHLKIGDAVEFEMTYDRRTGKPIASTVTKIAPEVVLSEARVTGIVTTEVKGEGSGDNTGRISYENRGECFFLPYTKDDVEGNVTLKSGDAVSFQIATNQRGNLGACHVRFENPAHPVKYHGVVCSMKESFGFIERADVVKEIFYHFTEVKSKEELQLGDDVEFIIQTRNGKEVACNITKLPGGSVVFEDVSPEVFRGQVLKSLDCGSQAQRTHQSDPLPGRIRYRAADYSEVEVPFGDKDQCGGGGLRHGDWVQFQVATDRRDQLRRATNISLLDESFHVSGERRERGVVCSLKEGFGFIRSADRDVKYFFHFAEVLRLGQELSVGDEVEYTVDPLTSFSNTKPRLTAIRIKHLTPGSVMSDAMKRSICGLGEPAPAPPAPPTIHYSQDPRKDESLFPSIGAIKHQTRYVKEETKPDREDDGASFQMYSGSHSNISSNNGQGNSRMMQGFIAALKDGFGFIETKDLTKEVFFHFSNLEGNPDTLELGREVEYSLGRPGGSGGGCASADVVRVLPRGSIPVAKPLEPILYGTVTRTLRALNPDQLHYSGLIQVNQGASYEFGIMGLACKREILQVGDPVNFQADIEGRATIIVPIRKKGRATVDAIKGGFGFLTLDNEDGKRLFFHMSEVRGNQSELQPGDCVEFVMITNSRNGKCSACNVVRVSGKPLPKITRERPERLINRIRATSLEDSTPRVLVTRHPKGPDGSRGFRPRQPISDILKECQKE